MSGPTRLDAVVDDLEARLGLRVRVHARDLDRDRECGRLADDDVVTASVFKVPILLELLLQADEGALDLRAPVVVPRGHRRVGGGTGLCSVLDDVTMSVRDLAWSMMSVSDNRATDIVLDLVGGVAGLNARMRDLGLARTRVIGDCALLFGQMADDMGTTVDGLQHLGSDEATVRRMQQVRPLDPARTSCSTPRETTELLGRLWTDDGLPATVCAEARRILALQVWPHRLASGFEDEVSVAGKTGTLWFVRNEAGVVEYPDGDRYAVAVFLRSARPGSRQPDVDRAIGTIGRAAVDTLRDARRG